VVRKALGILLTLFAVSIIIFSLVRLIPGDPAAAALGDQASREQIEQFRREMGLDKPIPQQYLIFISSLLRGKLGLSGITFHDAMKDILYYFPATLELTLVAMTLAFVLGVLIGVSAGLTENKKLDGLLSFLSIGGLSLPTFLVAITLQVIVGNLFPSFLITGRIGSNFNIPRVTGLDLIDSLLAANSAAFFSVLECLILPASALMLGPLATIMRLVRANTLREKGKSYIANLRANGLPRSLLAWRYLLPNAVSPALTLAGLQFAELLGGSFVIETIFVFPGVGWLGVQAMIAKDVNMIQGVALMAALYFVLTNTVVDFLHTRIDPRIRLKEQ